MFTEDLAPFFDTDEFAIAAVLDGENVAGIFVNPYAENFEHMATTQPQIMLPSTAAAAASSASVLVISAAPPALQHAVGSWRVRSVEPYGAGVSLLRLESLA